MVEARVDSGIKIRDASDQPILEEAIAAGASMLITGDRDLLDVAEESSLRILDPRGFWLALKRGE